jgi:hypothetical protein
MTKQMTGIIFLLLLSLGVSAQTAARSVEKIEKSYADVSEKARLADTDDEQGQYGGLFVNELTINSRNHQWRAVGIYGQTYKFYYRSLDTEDHMYPDQLVLATGTRRSSNRIYREEYLFSETGTLMFYYQRAEGETDTPTEVRIYFSGSKPIRIIEDKKSRDRMTAEDIKLASKVVTFAGKVRDLFNRSINL